jgi:hypothetical protein
VHHGVEHGLFGDDVDVVLDHRLLLLRIRFPGRPVHVLEEPLGDGMAGPPGVSHPEVARPVVVPHDEVGVEPELIGVGGRRDDLVVPLLVHLGEHGRGLLR